MYHLSVKCVCRASGRGAPAAAAYRAGDEIEDERTGVTHDYTRKGGVEHSEIIVPAGAPTWAEDRSALWNAAEHAEKRKDARVAREYEVAIPKELSRDQSIALVRDFAQELCDRYGVAVDFNLHKDSAIKWDGSAKGYDGLHAHVMTTTRRLGPEGFGAKAEPELSDTKRKSLGLSDGAAEIERVRQLWEVTANRHLELAGESRRIDRRSLKDQGVEREPTRHLGPAATVLERRGVRTDLGEVNRRILEAFQQGVQARHQVAELDQQIVDTQSTLADVLRERVQLQAAQPPRPRVKPREDKSWQTDRPLDLTRSLNSVPTVGSVQTLSSVPYLHALPVKRPGPAEEPIQGEVPQEAPQPAVEDAMSPRVAPPVADQPTQPQKTDLLALSQADQVRVFQKVVEGLVANRQKQAQRAGGAARLRLQRRELAMGRLVAARPVEPGGLLAVFKKKDFAEAQAAWARLYDQTRKLVVEAKTLHGSLGQVLQDAPTWVLAKIQKKNPEFFRNVQAHYASTRQKDQALQQQQREAKAKQRAEWRAPRPGGRDLER